MAGIPDNIVAILGVDNAGAITNIDPNLIFNKQVNTTAAAVAVDTAPSKKDKVAPVVITSNTETTISLAITADPKNIPMVNSTQDNLENSIVYQISKKIGINTKSPKWLVDISGGSLNVTPATAKDGYKLSDYNFAYADKVAGVIYIGDTTLLKTNLPDLIIRGQIPVTATGIDRILFINDLGAVSAKTDVFIESINGLTKKIQTFAIGTTGTSPNYVSVVSGSTGIHTLHIPLAANTSVTAGLISKAQYDIFNAKEPAIAAGTTSQYWRGDKTFVDFNTSARAAISLTTTGSGAATYISGVLNIPTFSFSSEAAGGELSGTYPNPTVLNSAVIAKVLTGLPASTTGSVASTDSILVAFSKVQTQLNSLVGAVVYKGTWNASTNSPSITSGVGTQGNYYIVNVAGTTTIDGISSWNVGDWIIFNGTTWQKVDNAATIYSAGTGIAISGANVISTTITQYTDTLARAAFSGGTGITVSAGGVIATTITQYTDTLARAAFSGGTGITVSAGGVIATTITQYTDTLARAAFSGGTGITVSAGGVIATTITQYTDALARAAFTGTGFVRSTAGVISYVTGTASQFVKADGSLDSSVYLTAITDTLIIAALTYTPMNNNRTITINGDTQNLSANPTYTITAGVSSFNTRTGAIVLSALDVTTALGFTPISTFSEVDTLQSVTSRGNTTSTSITAASFFEPSDIRFKNILGSNPDIDVSSIDVIKYMHTKYDTDKIRYGYSAQEVYDVCSDLVNDIDGALSVNYTDLHTLKIMQLEKRIAELEKIINA